MYGTVLDSQQYKLQPLDPRTVVREDFNKEEIKNRDSKLTFTLSSAIIDFGLIQPTSPVIRENTLKVSTSGLPYSIIAFEDHPPRPVPSVQDIPDTTCDDGNCWETQESAWLNPLAFGFGISLFSDKYRQLANEEAGEIKQSVANSNQDKELKVTYKVNIAKSQPAGTYINTITYILVPNF